ncbi:helix-turn-helix domain-containing protein [Actinomyces mediterranea]
MVVLAQDLRRQGMSLARIGRILNCSTSTIRRAVGC